MGYFLLIKGDYKHEYRNIIITDEDICKCQYKNVQKVENKNVHFIPLSLQTGCQEMLAFP